MYFKMYIFIMHIACTLYALSTMYIKCTLEVVKNAQNSSQIQHGRDIVGHGEGHAGGG